MSRRPVLRGALAAAIIALIAFSPWAAVAQDLDPALEIRSAEVTKAMQVVGLYAGLVSTEIRIAGQAKTRETFGTCFFFRDRAGNIRALTHSDNVAEGAGTEYRLFRLQLSSQDETPDFWARIATLPNGRPAVFATERLAILEIPRDARFSFSFQPPGFRDLTVYPIGIGDDVIKCGIIASRNTVAHGYFSSEGSPVNGRPGLAEQTPSDDSSRGGPGFALRKALNVLDARGAPRPIIEFVGLHNGTTPGSEVQNDLISTSTIVPVLRASGYIQ